MSDEALCALIALTWVVGVVGFVWRAANAIDRQDIRLPIDRLFDHESQHPGKDVNNQGERNCP